MKIRSFASLAATVALAAYVVLPAGAREKSEQSLLSIDQANDARKPTRHIYAEIPTVDLQTYAGVSSDVLFAEVMASRVIDVPGQALLTEYDLRVIDAYLGELSGLVHVQVAGGENESRITTISHAPRVAVGDRGVFFLMQVEGTSTIGIVGLDFGFYPVAIQGDQASIRGLHAPEGTKLEDFVTAVLEGRIAFEDRQGVKK